MITTNAIAQKVKGKIPNGLKHNIKKLIINANSLTANFRAKPSFIVAGIQKGGTTSLYNYLCQHPRISPILQKEIHFFDRNYNKGMGWYLGNFPLKFTIPSDNIVGEATPTYLYSKNAANRISEKLPNSKIIIVLRNPVDRAYSDFNYGVKLGFHKSYKGFRDRINKELEWLNDNISEFQIEKDHSELIGKNCAYLAPGLYNIWIKYWMNNFKNRLFILTSEEFFGSTEQVLNRIFEFLNLPKHDLGELKTFNSNDYQRLDLKDKQVLSDFYRPHVLELEQILGRELNWV
ncbi:MAG: sulfotransferase domain-containing protein [Bacteroidota bacterium]